jgi:DNA primase
MIDNLEDIRAGNPIVDVITQYVTLKKSGTQFVGLCPFHKEKTGSFCVHPVKGVYHCHGCGAGGDVIRFVREIERIDFPAAVRLLAERSGLQAITTSMTPAEKQIYAEQRHERELIEHFRLVEGGAADRPCQVSI